MIGHIISSTSIARENTSARTAALRRSLRLSPADLIFVAGSTMEGEEAAALAAYQEARATHPRLRLVLVPRHAERFATLTEWLVGQGVSLIRRFEWITYIFGAFLIYTGIKLFRQEETEVHPEKNPRPVHVAATNITDPKIFAHAASIGLDRIQHQPSRMMSVGIE